MKLSQVDKAIAVLEAERAVIDLAIRKLQQQRDEAKPKARRAPRLVKQETA